MGLIQKRVERGGKRGIGERGKGEGRREEENV
jgi:hypothetical protein